MSLYLPFIIIIIIIVADVNVYNSYNYCGSNQTKTGRLSKKKTQKNGKGTHSDHALSEL
jgi:hypothetical protein